MPDPAQSGWTSVVGPLPTSVLPRPEDLTVARWLDLIHTRQDVLAERVATIARALAALPEDLAASLIIATRREMSEGLARAHLAGRQGAVPAPCSLCRGEGCESPTCGRA